MSNKINLYILSCFVTLLIGCGSSEDSTPMPPLETAPVAAKDAIHLVQSHQREYVDLRAHIDSGENGAEVIDTLFTNDGVCDDIVSDKNGFFVTLKQEGICELKYTVRSIANEHQQASEDSGNLVLMSSSTKQADFPPIAIALIEGQQVEIDLTVELGSDFPAGYQLSPDVALLGSGNVVVDAANNKITYQGVSQGLSRLIYILSDNIDTKMGYIDLSVSEAGTRPPLTTQFTYPQLVDINQSVIVDLAPYISDPDGDDLQLVDVMSFNATVQPVDPNNITNKQFSFVATTAGLHYVSYLISDHRGGLSSNLVEIEVVDPGQLAKWSDITLNANVFSAPLTAIEAAQAGINFSGTHVDSDYSPSITMATMSFSEGSNYCAQTGRLPSSAELTLLATSETPKTKHNWPNQSLYLADDNGSPMLVEFDSGAIYPFVTGTYNVTCITGGSLTITPIDVEAVANGIDIAEFEVQLSVDGNGVDGETITATVSGSAVLESASVITSNGGKARFKLTSTKAQTNLVTVDYQNEQQATQAVRFIGDSDNSRLTSLIINKDKANADGVDTNVLTAQVTDNYSNPVENIKVDIFLTENNPDGSASAPSSLLTDENGEVVINITDTEEEGMWVRAYYTSTNNPPEISYQDQYINFYTYNTLAPIEAVGLIWAAPMTLTEGDLSPVTPDNGYTEDGTYGPAGMEVSMYAFYNADDTCFYMNYFGLTGWRLPSESELLSLYNDAATTYPTKAVFEKHGWPTHFPFWSETSKAGGTYQSVRLWDGMVASDALNTQNYVTCVHTIAQ